MGSGPNIRNDFSQWRESMTPSARHFAVLIVSCLLANGCAQMGGVPVPKKSTAEGPVEAPPAPPAAPGATAAPGAKAPAKPLGPKVATPPAGAAGVPAAPGVPPVDDTLSAREHVQNAINLLQTGEEQRAAAELDAALRKDPDNRIGRNLMGQVQADPATYFTQKDSFAYTVQPGESLSIIAKKFLDDPLKFHILAKYNEITDPSRLTPGQTIKIPGTKPPEVAAVEDSAYQKAKRSYDAGKYSEAIATLEGSSTESAEARDLLVLSYTKYADELAQKAELLEAQSVLEKAVSIQPNNEKLKKQLKQVEARREAAKLYEQGTDAVAAGDSAKALDLFTQVLKLDPTNEAAKKQIANLKGDAIEAIHKEALAEYNKQNLDKAISLWDSVLTMDPNHERAKLYRSRAIELKKNLERVGR
jgi:nucleoid-associated protein YgaU